MPHKTIHILILMFALSSPASDATAYELGEGIKGGYDVDVTTIEHDPKLEGEFRKNLEDLVTDSHSHDPVCHEIKQAEWNLRIISNREKEASAALNQLHRLKPGAPSTDALGSIQIQSAGAYQWALYLPSPTLLREEDFAVALADLIYDLTKISSPRSDKGVQSERPERAVIARCAGDVASLRTYSHLTHTEIHSTVYARFAASLARLSSILDSPNFPIDVWLRSRILAESIGGPLPEVWAQFISTEDLIHYADSLDVVASHGIEKQHRLARRVAKLLRAAATDLSPYREQAVPTSSILRLLLRIISAQNPHDASIIKSDAKRVISALKSATHTESNQGN